MVTSLGHHPPLAKEHSTGTYLRYLPPCGAAHGKTIGLARERASISRAGAGQETNVSPRTPNRPGRDPYQRDGNNYQLAGTHPGVRPPDDKNVMRGEGTRSHSADTHDPHGRRAAPSTLFSALRRPDREKEGSGAHAAPRLTRRGSIWGACALKKSGASEETVASPSRARLPGSHDAAQLAPAAASSDSRASGTRPSVRKKGGSRDHAARACPAVPEHWAGDYRLARVFGRLSDPSRPLRKPRPSPADPTSKARGTFHSLFLAFCSARILWATDRAIVIQAVGSAPHPSRAIPSRHVGGHVG